MATKTRHYVPSYPQNITPEGLAQYLFEEVNRISSAFDRLGSNLVLDELHVAPSRPVDGLVVKADGSDWDPGSGAGVYEYNDGVWNFLGGGP